MEGVEKDGAVDGNNHLVRRAITWEISDSEGDSDTESWNSTTVANHLAADVLVHAEKEKLHLCMRLGEAKEMSSLTSLPEVASCSPGSEKRKKHSPQETKMVQTKAEARMLERKLKKEERMRRKEQDALEKERRKEAAAALKSLRPDQCMKHVTVCLDPGLLEDLGSDVLLDALGSLECNYYIEPQTVPRSITWKRNISSSMSATDGLLEKADEEREVLQLLEPWDFLQRLFSLMQSMEPGGQRSVPDLTHLLPCNCLEGPSARSYSVVVIGLDTYRWYNQHHRGQPEALNPEQEEVVGPRLQTGPELSMTPHQIEEALVMLQLWGNTGVLLLETWREFAQHISAMTKAIAQRPYRKQLENQTFSFCTEGGWASGVRVLKDGTGLGEAWSRQIQQFNRVSPAMAAAITQAYPSPSLLLQAYRECSTDKERQLLLSDIQVRTEENERERRIGPDLSRRIYLFLVSTNPELVLDLRA
ncbi:probable crossover junction endonuclease EME2 [Elgaria multicarinata webbii]|uniref:probable crossover junction endonuclease EME2 n=1 Tax=Elgaria multicarinata webbii TaxID=159646 RepID=UPI002FCD637E